MKAKAAAARFGEVYEISKADWVREVTEASNSAWVVAHLYEDGIVECRVMEVGLDTHAPVIIGWCANFRCYRKDSNDGCFPVHPALPHFFYSHHSPPDTNI